MIWKLPPPKFSDFVGAILLFTGVKSDILKAEITAFIKHMEK